jgi:signal transduction histidine kinase
MNEGETKILVVDDDDAGRYVKTRILRNKGYVVSETALGQVAIEQAAAEHPDLILLDVMLPDISGIEACRRIKTEFPGIMVLQTSAAFTRPQDRTTALDGGADSFLVEPIDPDELLAAVNALLRVRRAERDLRRLNETLETQVTERTRELGEANAHLAQEVAERHKAEQALWHSQKLEAVGQLTGGVAHDFNNLLTVISGNLELVREALNGGRALNPTRLLRLIKSAQTAADRGALVTQQLLAFARRSMLRAETVDLAVLISAFSGFLQRALGEATRLEMRFAPELWSCRIDPVQFESAILNLAVNARDAMSGTGQVTVEAINALVGDERRIDSAELAAGAYVCVRVTDSGSGMSPEVAARAFEPFFTTKDIGKGSGLGLSQVYGFVKQSGGHVVIETTPGTGTTVSLYLPRSEPASEAPRDPGTETFGSGLGHETILVVEDNPEVRDVAVAMIGELGYRVLVAHDAASALELIRGGAPIDLLFTDVVMPGGMSGIDLARAAQRLRRPLRAILTSGHAGKIGTDGAGAEFEIIFKPYQRLDLARKLRANLDRDPATASPPATTA